MHTLEQALAELNQFIEPLGHTPLDERLNARFIQCIHVLDHLERLFERFEDEHDRSLSLFKTRCFDELKTRLFAELESIESALNNNQVAQAYSVAKHLSNTAQQHIKKERKHILQAKSHGELEALEASHRLQALRWLSRVSEHHARILKHLKHSITE